MSKSSKVLENPDTSPSPSKNVSLALVLIILGSALLLNTLGLISKNAWLVLWRLWPLVLILLGLKLILGSSLVSRIILGFFAFLTFAFVVLFALLKASGPAFRSLTNHLPRWFSQIELDSQQSEQFNYHINPTDYPSISYLDIDLKIGAGKFELNDGGPYLFNIDADYFPFYGRPNIETQKTNQALSVSFQQQKNFNSSGLPSGAPVYDISLGRPSLTTNLDVRLGAGDGDINLVQTKLDDLFLEIGAGSLKVNLDENSVPFGSISVNIGTGNVILTLPETVGIKLTYSVGLGNISIDDQSLANLGIKDGDYTSPSYSTSLKKVEIKTNVGVGNLQIKTVAK